MGNGGNTGVTAGKEGAGSEMTGELIAVIMTWCRYFNLIEKVTKEQEHI